MIASRTVDRRRFMMLSALGLGAAAAACSNPSEPTSAGRADTIGSLDAEIAQAESARYFSGREVPFTLAAAPAILDLGGRLVSTWSYGQSAVAPEIRVGQGDRLRATVSNSLDADTSIHWHGIRIRNDMDGVPPTTQNPITPGTQFEYSFVLPDPGTHWYHSHSGLQADRGLLGALIVEDPNDASGADIDAVLVLDDWLDGMGTTPESVLAALNPDIAGHGGHGSHGSASSTGAAHPTGAATTTEFTDVASELIAQGHGDSDVLGGMTQHISYPLHLVNGRPPNDPATIEVPSGATVRLRIINAGAETPYRFAIAGHEMTVIAADGFDVRPVVTDSILIGMAQRYDVLVTARSGAWPVVAKVEGRAGYASTVLRTTDAAPMSDPDVGGIIDELGRRLTTERDLRPTEGSTLDTRQVDRDYSVDLIQAGDRYVWGMAGPDAGKLVTKIGERVRITMTNTTTMWHPMHTHGHTFAVPEYGGLRRDTVIVEPGQKLSIEFDADNPGEWMFHCHNAYHFEAGMTANIAYIR